MARYPDIKRSDWGNPWKRTACVVTAEDGTFGLGITNHGGPVEQIINGHFAQAAGRPGLRWRPRSCWDVMRRISAPYGSAGLASYAISAVDIALWDLKGKLLGRPVYELLGGPQKESIPCYASNTDLSYGTEHSIAWFLELGFKAVKLFLREGPEAGIEGIRRSEELVARTREQIGPDVELMVDAWMSLNVEYIGPADGGAAAVPRQVAGGLPPARGHWTGTCKVRQRLPGVTLATGEHWYTIHPFALAASHGLVDILQPDIAWVGGMTASVAAAPRAATACQRPARRRRCRRADADRRLRSDVAGSAAPSPDDPAVACRACHVLDLSRRIDSS